MLGSVLKLAAATTLYLAGHSLLASRGAKRLVERRLGRRARNGLYRPLYSLVSIVGLVALAHYAAPLPDRDLYRAPRPWAGLLRAGQAAWIAYLLWGVAQLGLRRFLGLASLTAWLRNDTTVPREPEAQGPPVGADGQMRAAGPFRWSRHPMNFAQLAALWLNPRLTVRGLTFNLLVTLYTLLTSKNQEARLRDSHGPAYDAYRRQVPHYLLPGPN